MIFATDRIPPTGKFIRQAADKFATSCLLSISRKESHGMRHSLSRILSLVMAFVFLCQNVVFADYSPIKPDKLASESKVNGQDADGIDTFRALYGICEDGGEYPDEIEADFMMGAKFPHGGSHARHNNIVTLIKKAGIEDKRKIELLSSLFYSESRWKDEDECIAFIKGISQLLDIDELKGYYTADNGALVLFHIRSRGAKYVEAVYAALEDLFKKDSFRGQPLGLFGDILIQADGLLWFSKEKWHSLTAEQTGSILKALFTWLDKPAGKKYLSLISTFYMSISILVESCGADETCRIIEEIGEFLDIQGFVPSNIGGSYDNKSILSKRVGILFDSVENAREKRIELLRKIKDALIRRGSENDVDYILENIEKQRIYSPDRVAEAERDQFGDGLAKRRAERLSIDLPSEEDSEEDAGPADDFSRLCDKLCKELEWIKRRDKYSIYWYYTRKIRKALMDILESADRRRTVSTIYLVGTGKNLLELLLFAHRYPTAKIVVIDPIHTVSLKNDWEKFVREKSGMFERGLANVEFRDSRLEDYKNEDERPDLLYMSGVISDDHIIKTAEEAGGFLDALARLSSGGTSIVCRNFNKDYLSIAEHKGIRTIREGEKGFRLLVYDVAEPVSRRKEQNAASLAV